MFDFLNRNLFANVVPVIVEHYELFSVLGLNTMNVRNRKSTLTNMRYVNIYTHTHTYSGLSVCSDNRAPGKQG